jgi:DNA repair exonuclease SbcCD ATPase subunit
MQARMKHAAAESQEKHGQLAAELQAARGAAEEAQSRIAALEQEQRTLHERLADAAKAHAAEKAHMSQALADQEAQVRWPVYSVPSMKVFSITCDMLLSHSHLQCSRQTLSWPMQVLQLQAALHAKSQESQDAHKHLAATDAQLADALKERAALSEELSTEKARVRTCMQTKSALHQFQTLAASAMSCKADEELCSTGR